MMGVVHNGFWKATFIMWWCCSQRRNKSGDSASNLWTRRKFKHHGQGFSLTFCVFHLMPGECPWRPVKTPAVRQSSLQKSGKCHRMPCRKQQRLIGNHTITHKSSQYQRSISKLEDLLWAPKTKPIKAHGSWYHCILLRTCHSNGLATLLTMSNYILMFDWPHAPPCCWWNYTKPLSFRSLLLLVDGILASSDCSSRLRRQGSPRGQWLARLRGAISKLVDVWFINMG